MRANQREARAVRRYAGLGALISVLSAPAYSFDFTLGETKASLITLALSFRLMLRNIRSPTVQEYYGHERWRALHVHGRPWTRDGRSR